MEAEEEDSGSGVSPSLSRGLAVKRTKHNRKRTRRQSGIGDRHISRKSCHGEGRGWPSAVKWNRRRVCISQLVFWTSSAGPIIVLEFGCDEQPPLTCTDLSV